MSKLTELQKIANARNRLHHERELIKTQRAALRKDIKLSTNRELLLQEFRNAGIEASKVTLPNRKTIKAPTTIGYYNYADLHFRGQKDIKSLRAFFRTLKEDIDQKGYNHIVLFSGGDDIEGAHRHSTLLSIDKMPTGQAILYQKIILEELSSIANTVAQLDVWFLTSSNHTEWRVQGTAGEFPEDDALKLIGEYLKLGLKNLPNVSFKAQSWFKDIKYGKTRISFAHGNRMVHKNLYKFKALCPKSTIVLRNHTHHSELIQEPTFDNVVGPSTKLHVEKYEEGGGWVEKADGVRTSRTGQFIEFIPNKKTGRIAEFRIINI